MTKLTVQERETGMPVGSGSPTPDGGRGGAGGTTPAWLLVARREVIVKLTDRTFLISTGIMVALISAFMVFQAVQSQQADEYTLVTGPAAADMAAEVGERAGDIDDGVSVTVDTVDGADAARSALSGADSSAWLHRDGDEWVLTTDGELEMSLEQVVGQVIRETVLAENAAAAGTTLADLQEGTTLRTDLLGGDPQQAMLAGILGFAFAFLFYLAALLFGMQLAGSVVEEKQSRIVEIIATSIPLRQLLAGKVLGNTVLAFGQLAVYVAIGLVGLSFTEFGAVVPSVSTSIVWFLLFFLAGFLALACLWAVAGSLASRMEDLQATTSPLTMVVMAVFFGALFLHGTWQTVLSFVPPMSAVLMPIRLLEGEAVWWEAVVALAILLVFAALTVILGERIYRRSLLQTQGRVSLRQAWSSDD